MARAEAHATAALEQAEAAMSRKHMAWVHKMLGDIAVARKRFLEDRREYDAAISVLSCNESSLAEYYRERFRAVVQSLGDSIMDPQLRQCFLSSHAVRSIVT